MNSDFVYVAKNTPHSVYQQKLVFSHSFERSCDINSVNDCLILHACSFLPEDKTIQYAKEN